MRLVEKVGNARFVWAYNQERNTMVIRVINGNGNSFDIEFADWDELNHFSRIVYKGSVTYDRYNGIEPRYKAKEGSEAATPEG
jgi:hypothetical protein